ncbi:unnamed protein product, partial [Ilex paraguariensis]
PAGGGVVLRNEWGQMVLAGSYYYGTCSHMEVEVLALLDGLLLVKDYGLEVYPLIIETDTQVLVDLIKQNDKWSWKFWALSQKIFSILQILIIEYSILIEKGMQLQTLWPIKESATMLLIFTPILIPFIYICDNYYYRIRDRLNLCTLRLKSSTRCFMMQHTDMHVRFIKADQNYVSICFRNACTSIKISNKQYSLFIQSSLIHDILSRSKDDQEVKNIVGTWLPQDVIGFWYYWGSNLTKFMGSVCSAEAAIIPLISVLWLKGILDFEVFFKAAFLFSGAPSGYSSNCLDLVFNECLLDIFYWRLSFPGSQLSVHGDFLVSPSGCSSCLLAFSLKTLKQRKTTDASDCWGSCSSDLWALYSTLVFAAASS